MRLRIDLVPGCSVGPGKVSLLEAIAREGSLSEAARRLEMSYRRAWNLLDELNRAFAEPVVNTAVGGAQGGGASLTDFGTALVREYRALERSVLGLVGRRMGRFEPRRAPHGGGGRKAPRAR